MLHSQDSSNTGTATAGIELLNGMESWLLYEKGVDSYDNRNFGESLNYFNKLVERHGVYPEAEYWIGRVFEEEGEFILAEKQYLKALEAERVLHIPEEKYTIMYRLADLYKNRGDLDKYQDLLNSIVLDELESNQLAVANESPAINTLKRDGIDRMLLLFRHEFTYSVEAFNQLGIYYYKIGDYKTATSRLIYPLLSFFSISMEYERMKDPGFVYPDNEEILLKDHGDYVFDTLEKIIRRKNPQFTFTRNLKTLEISDPENQLEVAEKILGTTADHYISGASCCLELFQKDPVLSQLIEDYDLYRTIYYLAASLYAEGYDETAGRMWEIVANDDNSDRWGAMSRSQLTDPVVETGETIF